MTKLVFSLLLTLQFTLFNASHSFAQDKNMQIEATVIEVTENSTMVESDGKTHPYQRLKLIGTNGNMKGKVIEIEHGKFNQPGLIEYHKGDEVVVMITNQQGKETYTISDYVRRGPLIMLAAIFLLLTIFIGGKRGFNSILGMIITFVVLFLFVLPQLARGSNPILITCLASLIIIPVTFILSHGLNRKTFCAIIGTGLALILTAILAQIFITQAHLTGFASEEAGFLDIIKQGTLDIRGLLFAGIIIALLGILEDITISQSAIVMQLKEANSSLSPLTLFKRAMYVGKDHIASMANTLVLVYAGASLPLLLLFVDNPLPYSSVINSEIIAEEIVRTLVASIGLILAVPITTAIAAFLSDIKISSRKS